MFPIQLPAIAPGRGQPIIAQVLRSLPHMCGRLWCSSWLWADPALAVVDICGVSQWIEELYLYCFLCVCVSLSLPNKYIHFLYIFKETDTMSVYFYKLQWHLNTQGIQFQLFMVVFNNLHASAPLALSSSLKLHINWSLLLSYKSTTCRCTSSVP